VQVSFFFSETSFRYTRSSLQSRHGRLFSVPPSAFPLASLPSGPSAFLSFLAIGSLDEERSLFGHPIANARVFSTPPSRIFPSVPFPLDPPFRQKRFARASVREEFDVLSRVFLLRFSSSSLVLLLPFFRGWRGRFFGGRRRSPPHFFGRLELERISGPLRGHALPSPFPHRGFFSLYVLFFPPLGFGGHGFFGPVRQCFPPFFFDHPLFSLKSRLGSLIPPCYLLSFFSCFSCLVEQLLRVDGMTPLPPASPLLITQFVASRLNVP